MFGEILVDYHDVQGKSGSSSTKRCKRLFNKNVPMGRHIARPLPIQYSTIKEMPQFLKNCRYVSDQVQFGVPDYWIPPDEFSKLRQGDCEDYALWTWRQLIGMGYETRFVIGRVGKFRDGHAWVMVRLDEKYYIVEPRYWVVGYTLPKLSVLQYVPVASVAWDGKTLRYYFHHDKLTPMPWQELGSLISEWVSFWLQLWARIIGKLITHLFRKVRSL